MAWRLRDEPRAIFLLPVTNLSLRLFWNRFDIGDGVNVGDGVVMGDGELIKDDRGRRGWC